MEQEKAAIKVIPFTKTFSHSLRERRKKNFYNTRMNLVAKAHPFVFGGDKDCEIGTCDSDGQWSASCIRPLVS
ncbi:hypothetical protein KIN20_026475 [Parelaphostrongylus tenuis]|uniref:Uncharacterized protein n=1 Tax=Parelaphostrongylus tenuis TaxID=148309 RepID=A0AAD5QY44_PARTN|nr:hypothetical protein KIN20_026475 [Parelaphostrongylus tenuis]